MILKNKELKHAFELFVAEVQENRKNILFESIIPTIKMLGNKAFKKIGSVDIETQKEVLQRTTIKLWLRSGQESFKPITNLHGYIMTTVFETYEALKHDRALNEEYKKKSRSWYGNQTVQNEAFRK